MGSIEEFAAAYHHTFEALGAIASAMAVIISLTFAIFSWLEKRPKLKAYVSWKIISHPTIPAGQNPEYLSVYIVNKGNFPIAIPYSFFCWKVPFKSTFLLVSPLDAFPGDRWIPQRKYPVIIEANRSESFILSKKETFREDFRQLGPKITILRDERLRFIFALIGIESGEKFNASIDKQVKKDIMEFAKVTLTASII